MFLIPLRGLTALLDYAVHRAYNYGCCVNTELLYCTVHRKYNSVALGLPVVLCTKDKVRLLCFTKRHRVTVQYNAHYSHN